MYEFIVDRRFWIRGEHSDRSALYRPKDGKMCCMGFCAIDQGCTIEELRDISDFNWLSCETIKKLTKFNTDHIQQILNQVNESVYSINDDSNTTDEFKESELNKCLALCDVKINFIN